MAAALRAVEGALHGAQDERGDERLGRRPRDLRQDLLEEGGVQVVVVAAQLDAERRQDVAQLG